MVMAAQVATKPSGQADTAQQAAGKPFGKSNKVKPSYKHIPHSQKPAHLVAKRNARERRRVQAVNQAFYKLRRCVPIENRNKRVSKVKTLQRAIDYIRKLERILEDDDQNQAQQSQLVFAGGQLTQASDGVTSSTTTLAALSRSNQQQADSNLAPQTGKRRRTRVKSSTNCDQANQADSSSSQSQIELRQTELAAPRPRRGRRPATQSTTGSATSIHCQQVEQATHRFPAPIEPQSASQVHKFTEPAYYGLVSSGCSSTTATSFQQDHQAGEVLRESSAYNSNMTYFADQLEQHYTAAASAASGQHHYLAAATAAAESVTAPSSQQQQHQGGHYLDTHPAVSYPAGGFYASSAISGGHIGGGYGGSLVDSSSSWCSYRQPQASGWHECSALGSPHSAEQPGKVALNDSVASTGSSVASSRCSASSLNSTGSGIESNKPADLPGGRASLPVTADCSAIAAGSSPSRASQGNALSTSNTAASPLATAASNANQNTDNSSTPVVGRRLEQLRAVGCTGQQVNSGASGECLAYAPTNNTAHLSFAANNNNNNRDNNDNSNANLATAGYSNHHNHQRQLLDEGKSGGCRSSAVASGCNELGLLGGGQSAASANLAGAGQQQHQVRHTTAHQAANFSANNLHERTSLQQYHQLHHHHHEQQQQPFAGNQRRSTHLSCVPQQAATTTTASSLIQHGQLGRPQTIQGYTSVPL